MLHIHFAGLRNDRPVNQLASACGVGAPASAASDPRFRELFAQAPSLWRAAPLDDAQLVVYPHDYRDSAETFDIARAALARNLPCLFFRDDDDPAPANPPHGLVYRTCLFADRLTPCERAMPAFAADLLAETADACPIREKQQRPSVGFCGYSGHAVQRLAYQLLGRFEKARGLRLRCRALRALRREPRLHCDFIARRRFWGGDRDPARRRATRREFLDNLVHNDYALCLRGAGNFSFRFYEALSAGRIPLFINTRCVLPFPDCIDWRNHCLWVEEADLPRAGRLLADFHAQLPPDRFRRMQQDNRRLWQDWLSPLSFYRRALAASLDAPPPHNPARAP